MIKFKTLFRKAHGASSSSSGAKNKGPAERGGIKENHFESAVPVTVSVSQAPAPRNDTIVATSIIYDNNEFEKPAVTCSVVPLPPPRTVCRDDDYCHESLKSNENSFSKMSDSSTEIGIEYENLKKEFESVLDEKCNLEITLQELVKSHGELETVKKEIEELKVSRLRLRFGTLLLTCTPGF